MVVYEIVELEAVGVVAAHLVQALYRVCDLKEVVVVVAGVERLMQLVVGDGVQRPLIHPARIISVYDLPHQPEVGLDLVCDVSERFHKVKVEHVRRIETDTVHIKLAHPEADDITDVVLHCGMALVEFHEQVVSAPVVVAEAVVVLVVSPEVHIAVPVLVLGSLALFFDVFERKEIASCVVEHAVKDHPDLFFVAFSHEIL